MEITSTSKQGKTKVSDRISITYRVTGTDDAVKDAFAVITEDDKQIGFASVEYSGKTMQFSVNSEHALTSDEVKQTFAAFIDDIEQFASIPE